MYKLLLVVIITLSFLLRLVNITSYPGGFTPDEASFGYDAYSLLKTGEDQWGKQWPLTFKSFGDYKLPVYTYLVVPSIAIFGLTEFAVRLPNAILGSLAVVMTYLLAEEFFEKKKRQVSLFSAIFLAVSPWHITLSRGAFEATLTVFFLTAGVYFFLLARKKPWALIVSMLLFGINLFTYHSARLVTPLIVLSLLWFYRRDFSPIKRLVIPTVIFGIFLGGAIVSFFNGSGTRAATSTVFSQNLGSGALRAHVVLDQMPSLLGRVYYNEPSFKFSKVLAQYITYFSPQFLFTEGAHETTYGMVPGVGVLTFMEAIGLLSLIFLYRKREKSLYVLLFWLLIGAIPAAISIGPGHAANRAAVMMPAYEILAAMGIVLLIEHFSKVRILQAGLVVLSLAVGVLIFIRLNYEQPVIAGNGMMYGMHELFSVLKKYPDKHIILSRSLSEPHIFAAFFDPINPNQYQEASRNWNFDSQGLGWVDQQESYSVGKYTITLIDKSRDFQLENTLIVGRRYEMPEKSHIVNIITTPDGQELWVVAEKL